MGRAKPETMKRGIRPNPGAIDQLACYLRFPLFNPIPSRPS